MSIFFNYYYSEERVVCVTDYCACGCRFHKMINCHYNKYYTSDPLVGK